MARPLRIIYEGAVYHVTLRGNERKAIFRDDQDRERFLFKLEESLGRYDVRLYLYCLMTNHTHFILETPRSNLSRFMQRFQTAYAVYFNRRHNRHGHLWQGRFGASVVEEDEYILKLSRYVHLNPVYTKQTKMLLIRDRIDTLRAYPWSSYRSYIGKIKPLSFIDEKPILEMMGQSKKRQRSSYRRFVETGIEDIDAAFITIKSQSRLCIGSESFQERMESEYDALVQDVENLEDVSFRQSPRLCKIEDVLKIMCDVLETDRASLLRRCRDSMHRPLVALVLCEYCGLTQRQVAKELGLKSGAAVSHQIKRLSEAMQQDLEIKRLKDAIDQRILKNARQD